MEEETAKRRLSSITRHIFPLQPIASDDLLLLPSPVSSDGSICCSAPVIVGGMVLDIHAKPRTRTRPGTTTPGKVKYVNGGVARNIAECVAKLGTNPFMISVIGDDVAGDVLLQYWKCHALPTEGILKLPNIITPVVSNIFDADGELYAAVASVEAVEKCLTTDWIEQFRSKICSAPIVMVDANLHPQSLNLACQIAADYGTPVWFEPVSVIKSARVASIAKYITFVSPNEDELIAMASTLSSGYEYHKYQMTEKEKEQQSIETSLQLLGPSINLLLDKGIKFIVVTLGSDGALLCSRQNPAWVKETAKTINSSHFSNQLYQFINAEHFSHRLMSSLKSDPEHLFSYALHFPALSASVVSLTGAGDCLVGGVIASICSGLNIVQSMAVAISTAKAAVESEANVPPKFFLANVAADAKQVLSATRMFNLS